jgi:PIN domain nuclease of toxin-antitoxin system
VKRLLLDTHTLLYWAIDPTLLSEQAYLAIALGHAQVYVSAATAAEIAIKRRSGKLTAPGDIQQLVRDNRFVELPITFEHARGTEDLPPIHKDPFDRLLIAQARVEKLTLVTRDAEILKYDVPTIAA